MYAQVGLNGHAQDATAWLCKAIGQSGRLKYGELLSEVVQKTPYEKIRKHAKRYAFLPYSSGTETASLESQPITNYKVAGTYASKITSGFWTLNLKSSTPKIKIQQTGNNVNGTYGKGSGNFDGVIVGNTITIEWYTVRGSGKGTLKINPENNQLVGSFGNSKWNLKKIE